MEQELPGFKDTAARLKAARRKLEDARRGPPPVNPDTGRRPPPDNVVPLPPPKRKGGLLALAAVLVLAAVVAGVVLSGVLKPPSPRPGPSPAPEATPAATGWKVIALDGREHGPVSLDELQRWIAERRVVGKSMVRELPDGGWKTIESDSALAAHLPAPPPVQPEPAPVAVTPAPEVVTAVTPPPARREGWHFTDDEGREQGPVSREALLAMIGAGQVDEDTRVKAPGADRYRIASRHPELRPALQAYAAAGPEPVPPPRRAVPDQPQPFSPPGWWRMRMTENVRLSGLRTEADGYVNFDAFGNFTYTGQVVGGPFAGAPMMLQGAWAWDPARRQLEVRHPLIDGSINVIQANVTGAGDSFRATGSSLVGAYSFEFQRGAPNPGAADATTQQLLELIRQFGR